EVLDAEYLLETLYITRDRLEPLDARLVSSGGIRILRHLDGIGERPLRLCFQRGCPAVPELGQAVGAVDHGRGAAAALLLLDARGTRRAIGEAPVRAVAARACHRAVGREPLVEVQEPAQLALGVRVGIVLGPDDGRQTLRRRRWLVILGQRDAQTD